MPFIVKSNNGGIVLGGVIGPDNQAELDCFSTYEETKIVSRVMLSFREFLCVTMS